MVFAKVDWGVVLRRAGYILALWVGLWLLRRLIVKRIPTLLDRFEHLEFTEKDIRLLMWLTDVSLLLVGLMVTSSILHIAPWLVIGAIGSRLIALVLLWLFVWLLVRYLRFWIKVADERVFAIQLDVRDITTLERLLGIAIILIAIVVSLAILRLTSLLYSALTAAGVFGIAIGFAVKDIAANFISGIIILTDRPFVVGDAVQVDDISGTVAKISLRSTQLTTWDGTSVYIPNSMVVTQATTNYSVIDYRRILFVVSVLGTVDLNRAIKVIQDTLSAEPRLLADRPPSIYVDQIRDYVVDLQVIAYTSSDDLFDTQSDLKKAITTAFTSQGINLAVPIRVNITEGSSSEPIAGLRPEPGAAGGESSSLRS
jgi:small conductance mechanosensitive channel